MENATKINKLHTEVIRKADGGIDYFIGYYIFNNNNLEELLKYSKIIKEIKSANIIYSGLKKDINDKIDFLKSQIENGIWINTENNKIYQCYNKSTTFWLDYFIKKNKIDIIEDEGIIIIKKRHNVRNFKNNLFSELCTEIRDRQQSKEQVLLFRL